MPLPKLIIIGVAKAGTTALWYNLDKHPDIFAAKRREEGIGMHFWGGKHWVKGLDWYSDKFEEGKIGLEKSISYWLRGEAIKKMSEHIPDIKLFLCVRNPADRAYSHYQMHNNKAKVKAKMRGNKVKDKKFKYKDYFSDGVYINKIKSNILPYIKKKQLYVCVCEHMKKDPTTEMKKVFEFIGVDDLNLPKKVIDGILRRHRNREEDMALNRQEPFYRVWDRWSAEGALVGPEREELLELYKPHNERLFDFLGYEIKEWSK